jgi:hypothetical protein
MLMSFRAHESKLDRRSLLKGAVIAGTAVALPAEAVRSTLTAPAAEASTSRAPSRANVPPAALHPGKGRRPATWPALEPYGLADTREDLWPRDDNSFILPLELRPQDEARGQVWIRDLYVNCFTVGGRPLYVASGTTRAEGLDVAQPWNDGLFVWTAPALKGPWKLVDTTKIRPDAQKGKVWSPEFVGENTPDRTVVAPWQEYWSDAKFPKRGEVWAPEIQYFRGRWYIVACMGDHSKKVGSFLLVSDGGVEGPYRVAKGNLEKPFGDAVAGGPAVAVPGEYYHIDGSMFTEGDSAWLVLHNNLYAPFTDDMEDITPTTALPAFAQQAYSPEPYLEGAFAFAYGGKYYLVQAAWDRTSVEADGEVRQGYDTAAAGRVQYQYDLIAAVADHLEGPYSERWTLGVGCGGNNLFVDASGDLWATFFRNPAAGYWSNASRTADAAVPGVVRLEWTGPASNRIYVQRRTDA